MRKNSVEVIIENTVAISRLRKARLSRSKSWMPTPRPMPMMGPIRGDMSMAPIMTAVELVFRPSEAMKMARMRITRLVPRNDTPSRIDASASLCDTR